MQENMFRSSCRSARAHTIGFILSQTRVLDRTVRFSLPFSLRPTVIDVISQLTISPSWAHVWLQAGVFRNLSFNGSASSQVAKEANILDHCTSSWTIATVSQVTSRLCKILIEMRWWMEVQNLQNDPYQVPDWVERCEKQDEWHL